jgi:predicted Na+-dependent transporter
MTQADIFGTIAKLSGLMFAVTSMLALGMRANISTVIQPLKNLRLVALALIANFVLVPLLAYLLMQALDPDLNQSGIRVGLLVLATAAGAPFLPKLVQAP